MQDRAQISGMLDHADNVDTVAGLDVAVCVGKHVQLATPRAHFLKVGFELFQQRIIGRDRDNGHVLVHQRQRAVLEFSGRIGLGMDVGNLLEFERAFHRYRVMHAATEEKRMLFAGKALGPLRHFRFERQNLLQRRRQVAQRMQMPLLLLGRQPSAQLRKHKRQQEQRRQLGGECLGRCDPDLGACAGEKFETGEANHRAFRNVADRQTQVLAERFCVLQRCNGIGRLPRLRDGNDQRVRVGHAFSVAVFAGDLDRAGYARDRLDPVTRHQSRMVAGAAGEHRDRIDALQQGLGVHPEQLWSDRLRAGHHFQGVGHGTRLLENLLLHVVTVRPQFDRIGGELALVDGALGLAAIRVENAMAVQPELRDIAFLQIDHSLGDLQQRRGVRGREILALAQPQQ